MQKREDTAARIARRKYEERNKEKRNEDNKIWGTSLKSAYAEEIDEFLKRNGYTKVQLINAGYKALVRKEKQRISRKG